MNGRVYKIFTLKRLAEHVASGHAVCERQMARGLTELLYAYQSWYNGAWDHGDFPLITGPEAT